MVAGLGSEMLTKGLLTTEQSSIEGEEHGIKGREDTTSGTELERRPTE